LTVGVFKEGSYLGQCIDVGSLGNLVSIASEGIGFEVVGNDQQYVFDFRVSRKAQGSSEEKNYFGDHELR
jgi:hypothetical protein